MRGHGEGLRGARRTRARAAFAVLALCGTLVLTGCNGDDEDGAAGTPGGSPATTAPATGTASPAPSATTSPSSPASPKKPAPTVTAAGTKKAPEPGSTCDHKMPISPDEVAVYRYTPKAASTA